MLTTSKQIVAYPGLRLPKGYLVATTNPGSIPRSLVPNIIHRLSLPSAIWLITTPTPSFNLSGERRRTSYPMERTPWRTPSARPLLFDRHKRETLASVYPSTSAFTRNRVWQKDNRRCKLMVYTKRRCTPLWAQHTKLMYTSFVTHLEW